MHDHLARSDFEKKKRWLAGEVQPAQGKGLQPIGIAAWMLLSLGVVKRDLIVCGPACGPDDPLGNYEIG